MKATKADIARQLHGNWQEVLLYRLGQELAAYRFCQTQITECDQELAKLLRAVPDLAPELRCPKRPAGADVGKSGAILRNSICGSCYI